MSARPVRHRDGWRARCDQCNWTEGTQDAKATARLWAGEHNRKHHDVDIPAVFAQHCTCFSIDGRIDPGWVGGDCPTHHVVGGVVVTRKAARRTA